MVERPRKEVWEMDYKGLGGFEDLDAESYKFLKL